MAGYRQLHTRMWASDQWFLDLTHEFKLLFIYLFSNERASVCGLYELPFRLMCFETGLDKEVVLAGLEEFGKPDVNKVQYDAVASVVWVRNMYKYQGTESPQIKKRVIADIKAVPDCELKRRFISENRVLMGYADGSETLHSISSPINYSSSELEGGGTGEETNEIEIPVTPRQAIANQYIQAYNRITGVFPGDRDYAVIIDAFKYLQEQQGENYVDYLVPYWTAWSTRKTKDGVPYKKNSRVWYCEWAMQGDIPKANGHEPKMSKAASVDQKVALLRRRTEEEGE